MGRCRKLRQRIEARHCEFTHETTLWPNRQVSSCRGVGLPWSRAYSLEYSPRNAPPASMHAQFISWHIFHTLLLMRDQHIRHLVVVPFTWRNSRTIALATIAGLLNVYQVRGLPTCYTICALDEVSPFEYWLDNHGTFTTIMSSWSIGCPLPSRWQRAFVRNAIWARPSAENDA